MKAKMRCPICGHVIDLAERREHRDKHREESWEAEVLKRVRFPLTETIGPIDKPKPTTPGIDSLEFPD